MNLVATRCCSKQPVVRLIEVTAALALAVTGPTGYLETKVDSSGNPTTYKSLDLSAVLKL